MYQLNIDKECLIYIGGGLLTNILCYYIGYQTGKKRGIEKKCDWCNEQNNSQHNT